MNRSFWLKPEYLYRPRQVFSRLLKSYRVRTTAAFIETKLPWGLPIKFRPNTDTGNALLSFGISDLMTTETLWRLLDAGETAVDIGANIGYMTAVLGGRLMGGGTIYSFEAHPAIYEELRNNVQAWQVSVE